MLRCFFSLYSFNLEGLTAWLATGQAVLPIVRCEEKSDEELASLVSANDHDAFALLVNRHNLRFYRLAYRYLLDQAEAEDIVQECYLKFWQRPYLWKADTGAGFTTWFSRIIINACLDYKRKPSPTLASEAPESEASAWENRASLEAIETSKQEAKEYENHKRLHDAMKSLPERQRMAVNLVYYEKYSHQQTADSMGINLRAAQSLVQRAKRQLQQYFLVTRPNEASETTLHLDNDHG